MLSGLALPNYLKHPQVHQKRLCAYHFVLYISPKLSVFSQVEGKPWERDHTCSLTQASQLSLV